MTARKRQTPVPTMIGGNDELRKTITESKHLARCPVEWSDLILEAQDRGYLEIHGSRIKYNCAESHEENFIDPEEKVRAALYSWLILDREYPAIHIKVEVLVPRRTPSDRADIVVYTDSDCATPYLVVETKKASCTNPEFKAAIEQGFGNSNSLRDTHLCLVDKGTKSQLYQVADFPHSERRDNLLGDRTALPKAYGDVSRFPIVAGSASDIKPPTARDLEAAIRRAHGLIWAGGKRDPLSAFDEWCKLLFAKIHDERHTKNDDPRRFQVGVKEAEVSTANRIRDLYQDAQREDPSIFSAPIALTDEKITQVARLFQEMAFTQADIDTLGAAFEAFFGQIFRGELGQYFTRRELVRFVCAILEPTDRDKVLDPTCGSGGFLLETLIQVWHYIDANYVGQPDQERRRLDFAKNNLFGIEIQETLGRVCQTNLMIHKDGHTNIETNRSCLDNAFRNPLLDAEKPIFTLVVGNPPFGDDVEEGDRDHLGGNRLSNFELPASSKIDSEHVVTERSIKWLVPGSGRIGFVVPDGMLNNSGESSRCPAFRRWLFLNCQVLAIVSLADYAFRKSGAQNKTSILFARRYSEDEKSEMHSALVEALGDQTTLEDATPEQQDAALAVALRVNDYEVFLAEADELGYTPSGAPSERNELFRVSGLHVEAPADTILGQYRLFKANPDAYADSARPACCALSASEIYSAHRTHRIDPKYHIFKTVEEVTAAHGLSEHLLGEILERREEKIVPNDEPDRYFQTITLTQEGELEPREAGKGNNPPDWHGAYFKEGQAWYVVHKGDILLSRIDLWKGCIGVVPDALDGGVVTNEFPAYTLQSGYEGKVDLRYVQLLLRTGYFQRAIRAITTGHSNRRRTQEEDFKALKVFLPDISIQERVVSAIQTQEERQARVQAELSRMLEGLDEVSLAAVTEERLEVLFPDS